MRKHDTSGSYDHVVTELDKQTKNILQNEEILHKPQILLKSHVHLTKSM